MYINHWHKNVDKKLQIKERKNLIKYLLFSPFVSISTFFGQININYIKAQKPFRRKTIKHYDAACHKSHILNSVIQQQKQ